MNQQLFGILSKAPMFQVGGMTDVSRASSTHLSIREVKADPDSAPHDDLEHNIAYAADASLSKPATIVSSVNLGINQIARRPFKRTVPC